MNVTSALESDLARFYRGRRVVLLGHPLSAYGRQSAALLRTGAHAPFVVAGGTGPGQPPDGIAGHHLVPLEPADAELRAEELSRLAAAPPPALRAVLDGYDPDRTAVAVAETALAPDRIAGRPILDSGARWGEVFADHGAVDSLWARLGATRLPSVVVPADGEALERAHSKLDLGQGTVVFAAPQRPVLRAGGPVHRLHESRDAGPAARRLAPSAAGYASSRTSGASPAASAASCCPKARWCCAPTRRSSSNTGVSSARAAAPDSTNPRRPSAPS